MSNEVVAIVGATGLVGHELVRVLEERSYPMGELRLLGSKRSERETVTFHGKLLPVMLVTAEALADTDLVLFSAGEVISRRFVPRAKDGGAVVIDNSSAFRLEPDVPLVVPEVNPEAIDNHQGLIANPNCSTIQLVLALKPLHDRAALRRVLVTTFQSVSGAGRTGMTALEQELAAPQRRSKASPFSRPIAFDLLPEIGPISPQGHAEEELKLVRETRRILGTPALSIGATAVRVPTRRGHAISAYVETEAPIPVEEARALLAAAPGVKVWDQPQESIFPTLREVAGTDMVWVGRLRSDPSVPTGLHLWIVADNLRKGAALNAVQIAELAGARAPA